ncbi:MAG: aminotransferase class IV [Draconibacterium sp.]|nr:aminotransferase class IV [Draconibacterium sp.]
MINFNGNITDNYNQLSIKNRGFRYGDALFETMKVVQDNILFWEDHYFRLMASMRIVRMEIPMEFTMEYLEKQILETIMVNGLNGMPARVRLYVYRKEGGLYTPKINDVEYMIEVDSLKDQYYTMKVFDYEVDLFKDYYVAPGLLSTLKTNNKILNVVGSIYAKENKLQNCLLLNTNKQVVEALNGNIFIVKGNELKTPPLEDGCLKGVMRKQIMDIAKEMKDITLKESSISPFELQKVDEMFITNTISGIISVKQYRKKTYVTSISKKLLEKLNTGILN